ncbi:hypothetical protein NTGBS_920021 [Candidatus Nitrotoga sp. BS]|uniref:hypothetical protein n=1 Tax=Candidatus Nitrotoga sp. BS TaxID=2890408 RepID=UPI001EF1D05C|nr:hypothetical protein [Candidatus Nitrotoga sp. BS]CAH1211870.1 hypothetical protein NTGBS_920021 [Candidatus Nitrotoga sp. BS]
MKRGKLRAIVTWILGIVVCTFVAVSAMVMATSQYYFENHYVARNPVWISDIFLSGRAFLGQYREPPSNEAMIRYFHENEAEFEQLTNDYYALIKQYYDTKKYPEPNEILRFKMAELGIRRVRIGGPTVSTSIYGNQPLQVLGINLLLFDRGGSLRAYPDAEKGYSYATRVKDQAMQKQHPISYLAHTGQYAVNRGVPKFCEKREVMLCCGFQEISANWAAINCVNASN